MDTTKIDRLLEKYWQAETTVEEEAQLKAFFAQEELPPRFREAAALFRYFGEAGAQEMPESDETAGLIAQEGQARGVAHLQKGKSRKLWVGWLQVAASIAVFVALVALFRSFLPEQEPQATVKPTPQDTYTDPREAYEQTKKALLMISHGMGTGTSQMNKLEKFHEAQEKVGKKN